MKKHTELVLPPEIAFDDEHFHRFVKAHFNIHDENIFHVRLLKRSIDARSRIVKVNVAVEVYIDESPAPLLHYKKNYPDVRSKSHAVIVGAGPAGLFAALRLIELGIKPVVIERGKNVRDRRRDLANINKKNIVNPESNYCFGEGGAGTYSDGKLYTRSKKRGDVRRILEIMVAHGAHEMILADVHPHIGTNKLPKLVEELRISILKAGGEIYFNTKLTDIVIRNGEVANVIAEEQINGNIQTHSWNALGVILATGHSARDVFQLLHSRNIYIEAKPFALGVRIEHSQQLIDRIQYHGCLHNECLPAASYSLVDQVKLNHRNKGVFSFCMCPGGFVVPAATSQNEIVVNGMSPSKRDSPFANSGMVVSIDETDWKPYLKSGPLAALEYQSAAEQNAWKMAGSTQAAPAQRMLDFVSRKVSASLPATSYQPGVVSVDMQEVLPLEVAKCLQEGFKSFGKKMHGYLTNDAQIIGVESRTSSPVKIPRDAHTFQHIQVKRLFPCGEGAGYAGGIMSAAMDGERCAEKLAELYGRPSL
jgi:uncharacterized FAD-dependent dehydrogenase